MSDFPIGPPIEIIRPGVHFNPSAPAGISVPANITSGSNVTVSWGASESRCGCAILGYRLERSINGGQFEPVFEGLQLSSVQSISHGWTSVAFRVAACSHAEKYGEYCTSNTIRFNSAPNPPPSINIPGAIQSGGNITVSWGAATDPDGNLAGYRLERSVNGGAWGQVYQGAATSSAQPITAGWLRIAFRVKAYDTEGLESGYATSGTVNINTPPTVPASINVPGTIRGGTDITVSWAASTDPENNLAGYRLERSVNGGGFQQCYQGAAASSAQSITLGWRSIVFRVKAYDSGGLESGYRTGGTVAVNSPPNAPGAITIPEFPIGDTTITVSWSPATDPEDNLAGYRLERSVNGGAWEQCYEGAAVSCEQLIGHSWQSVVYRVKAYDTAGLESPYATSITAIVNSAPTVPASITVPATIRDKTVITVFWEESTDPEDNLAGYRLERAVDGGEWQQCYEGAQTESEQAIAKGWSTIAFRVRAFDAGNLESPYRTGDTVTIYNNAEPDAPAFIDCAPPPKVKKATTLTCGAATDPDGDAVRYQWQHSLDGGAYEDIATTDDPTATDTLPEECLTYQIRVRAVDEYDDTSPWVESPAMDVIPNEPPTVPGAIAYTAVREGRPLTLTCGESTDPDDDRLHYGWERSVDGGEFAPIGETDEPEAADTVPVGAATYQVRVRAVDEKGNASDYRTGGLENVIPNAPPVISGADEFLGDREQPVDYRYTVTDTDPEDQVLRVTETLSCGDRSWVMRVYEANSGEENTFLIDTVWLELYGRVELVVEAVDSLGATATRRVTFVRTAGRMAAYRSFETQRPVSKCLFGIDLSLIPQSSTLTLEVTNNPFDAAPVWEDVSAKVNREVHFFKGNPVDMPGLAYRFIVTKGTETAALEKITVKYA